MASLRKFKDSRYWFAVYRDADGNQRNKSTKILIAGEGDSERARGKDAAEKRKLARKIAEAYENTEHGHPTEAHVQKVLFEIFNRVNKRRLEPTISKTFFETWLGKVKTRRGAGGTYSRYKTVVDRFIAHLGPRAALPISDVLSQDVQAFIDGQAELGKSASTVRIDHKIINSVFTDALRQGVLATNPAAAVAVPLDAGESRRPFDWGQIRALLAAANGEWRTLIMLAAFTGARLGDCCAMTWGNVDLPCRVIRFRPRKTKAKGGELVIPIHPDLEAHLMALSLPDGADASEVLLCPTLAAAKVGGRDGLSIKFQKLMDAANIENIEVRKGTGRGRKINAYSFHSLRHSFNSELINRGVGEDLRMRLSGHASAEMNRRYSHAQVETLRAAVEKLPRFSAE